jgi:hypothetical protein
VALRHLDLSSNRELGGSGIVDILTSVAGTSICIKMFLVFII